MKRGARQSPTVVIAISQNNGRGLPRLASSKRDWWIDVFVAGWHAFLTPFSSPYLRGKACYEVFQSIVLVSGYWVFIGFCTPVP